MYKYRCKISDIVDCLSNHKIAIYDIGARGGIEAGWVNLIDSLNLIAYGFEPSKEECVNLNKNNKIGQRIKYFDFGVSDSKGKRKLFVTKNLGCSSCKKPNIDLIKNISLLQEDSFTVKKEILINVDTLNNIIDENKLYPPTFLKIDVQGQEYEVLTGCSRYLKDVQGIKLECRMKKIYNNEKTFFEIYDYLTNTHDFILRAMKPIVHWDGDEIEWDVFFTKKIEPGESFFFNTLFSLVYKLDPPRMTELSKKYNNNNSFYYKYIKRL